MARSPALSTAGHLTWTRSGTVWATWCLRGVPYGYRPDKDKEVARALHQGLIRGLAGESLWLGVCADLDPAAVVEQMIEGVDLDAHPDWAAECEATLGTLDAFEPGRRVFFLSVPLSQSGRRAGAAIAAATADFRDRLALPRRGVPDKELARAAEQARKIQMAIPAGFDPSPVTVAQLAWLSLHAQQRGLGADPDLPDDGAGAAGRAAFSPPQVEPLLDEGGQSDLTRRELQGWNPLNRRYLKVAQAQRLDAPGDSYQALLVLADVPPGGSVFPGSEFVGRIDESGLEVDWAIRLHVTSGPEVMTKNRRALISLNEQYLQREGAISQGGGSLDRAGADLAEYTAILESDRLEVEAQSTIIFCVAATDPVTLNDRAAALQDYLGAASYRLAQPLGAQTDLWWAMWPGAPTTRTVKEFAQLTTSRNLATTVPFASTDVGDSKGSLLGLNITTGRLGTGSPVGVVLHDVAGASARDISGAIAIAGELGAGKALAVDTPIPTPGGWVRMGELVPGDQVFDESGCPTAVLAVSAVMVDRPCYRVGFSDGSDVVADAGHLWSTVPRRVRAAAAQRNFKTREAGRGTPIALAEHTQTLTGPGWFRHAVTATTEQLLQTLRAVQSNHAIPVTGPLALPDVDLPIDPYVLGAWLGDGSSRTAQITSADPELLTFIEAAGYTVTALTGRYLYAISMPQDRYEPQQRPCAFCGVFMSCWYPHRRYCSRRCAMDARMAGAPAIPNRKCVTCEETMVASSTGRRCRDCGRAATLGGRLRLLGLIRNKHVPQVYLRASIAQRQTLLAGLLDTDGTVSPGGSVEFGVTNEQLARDVHELVCSLGYRASFREGRALLEGRDCGPTWTVSFTTTDPVFRLTRKQQTQRSRTVHCSPARNRFRYVTAVDRVDSVPVRCIQVAAESGLFLAERSMVATHNSVLQKKICGDVVDRGGRVIAIDRTKMGEWAQWADSISRATVVDCDDPSHTLDPLRLFGARAASRVTQSFLTPLLNVSPTSSSGVLLSEVLEPAYLTEHTISTLGGLLTHLAGGCKLEGAADLARTMRVFSNRDFGRVIFDPDLPPLPTASATTVIRTHTLELPSLDELQHAHLFAQMRLEKVFGRALYALVAALARQICFSDLHSLGIFALDEIHHFTASPEGEREIVEFVRDCRKHNASIVMGSHDPEADFGSATLRGLVPTRILMRHRDKTLAKRGLAWLDLDPDDEELIDTIVNDTSPVGPRGVEESRRGECFIRDSSGRIGRMKVLAPALPARAQAAFTSPPELRQGNTEQAMVEAAAVEQVTV